jgi:dTDP-3-amino-3,4,6-trideoxy-alpha-D-glucose transaminase
LRHIKERFGCRIVEDCAQSIGASFGSDLAGSVGDAAATSFYPTKNLGAMGDGGAILTSDATIARTAATLRDYGQTSKYMHEVIGYNSRLDELQAALLRRAWLPELGRWTARRRALAERYLEELRNPAIQPLGAPTGSNSCWHLFPVLVDPARKREFMEHLAASGVMCGEHYPIAIPDQKALRGAPHEIIGDCARARRLCASEATIPIHPYLTDEEATAIIAACNGWAG